MMQRLPVLQDYEPLSSRRLGAYLHAMVGLPPPAPEAVQPFIGTVPFTQPIARPELLDLLAVRSLLLPAAVRPPVREPPLTSILGTAKFTLYRNPHALPRAFTVSRARFVEDEQAALATVCARDFDGRREAVLVGRSEATLVSGPRTPFRAARIVDDRPERVTVEVAVEEPSLLVLADAYAPGWSAAVDGAARTLHQANHYVRGVAVHPGDRRVEFSYRPPGFAAGVAAAALAWGALGLAVVVTRGR